jgi:hypothetical protein
MTLGHLNKALKSAGISTLAATWMREAQDRNAWRDRSATHTLNLNRKFDERIIPPNLHW